MIWALRYDRVFVFLRELLSQVTSLHFMTFVAPPGRGGCVSYALDLATVPREIVLFIHILFYSADICIQKSWKLVYLTTGFLCTAYSIRFY